MANHEFARIAVWPTTWAVGFLVYIIGFTHNDVVRIVVKKRTENYGC